MKLQTAAALSATCSALVFAGSASATLTNATYYSLPGVEGMGAFVASVTYDYSSGDSASLTIALTNTSNAAYGGYITALALNGAEGTALSGMIDTTSFNFKSLTGPIEANPFPEFETGASTSSSWLGGGNPAAGIGIGSTVTFTFAVLGDEGLLGSLTAYNVLCPENGCGIGVRFRGFNNGLSDKVLGFIPGPGGLGALAIAALCSRRRRR